MSANVLIQILRSVRFVIVGVIVLGLFLINHNIYAFSIIRDSEIEEAINLVIDPIVKVSGLTNLKIHIINDEAPNAFTIGGNDIFIHSGLIVQFPDPDTLRGVIAHEIGHILGHHIARNQEVMNNYNKFAVGSAILGIVTAMSTGSTDAALASVIGGAHLSSRAISAYSRSYESSADQASFNLLEKSGHSAIGLIRFFEASRINWHSPEFANPYEQSHPMNQDRLRVIKNFFANSKYQKSNSSKELWYKYIRSSAKLAAYTLGVTQDINMHIPSKYDLEVRQYIRAIKDFRLGRLKNAIEGVDYLISQNSNDPYYYELKGQIAFEYDSNLALKSYDKAVSLAPQDKLLKFGRNIVGITRYLNDPGKMLPFYKELLSFAKEEPDNLLALYYLAVYYEKSGLFGKSYLNSAIIAYKTGNFIGALNMAKAAYKKLTPESPDWYKANDIIQLVNSQDRPH